ncbi:hypothetical protein HN587_00815 [Candidatus Woesearchaeota archaeon]|jgi:hypothetical protein|nr:hypothetical protein [Candidatus Woesearchaeota archaeon]
MTIKQLDIGPNGTIDDALRGYFRDLVQDAFCSTQFQPSEHAEFYLVNLLASAVNAKNIEVGAGLLNGVYRDAPLAIAYLEGINMAPPIKFWMMKSIGDFALFHVGFFPQKFDKGVVKIDYFVTMGSNAYQNIAHTRGYVFDELAQNFDQLCEALWIVSGNDRNHKYVLQGLREPNPKMH